MANTVIALKQFAVGVIETRKLPLPVKVELLDAGCNPVYVMTVAGKTAESVWQFSDERIVRETLAIPKPLAVRFTAAGQQGFILDFPDEEDAKGVGA